MDLFNLAARLTLDSSNYEKGIKNARESGKGLANNIQHTLSTAAKALTVTVGAAYTAAAGVVTKVTKDAFSAYAELEQNIGGSEVVFKNYASTIQKHATEAYKNMGVSANEYLETANKIGSLLQGSGFSEGEATELTMDVMQRAADQASIMGISTSAAFEAITGAAKGNFTMMDNLGVAINATTIEEYALSKGIKKSYNEMSTAEKVGLAFELFMDKTADSAGNYAKENGTLAGSMSTLKAAWSNLLAGVGGSDEVIESLNGFLDALGDAADKILPNLFPALEAIVQKVSERLPGFIERMLPVILETAGNIVKALPDLLSSVLTGTANGIITILNETFGLNLPKIDKIKFPSFDEIKEGATVAVDLLVDGINGLFGLNLPHIEDIKLPSWKDIQTGAATILDGIVNGINGFFTPTAEGGINIGGAFVAALDALLTALGSDEYTSTFQSIMGAIGDGLSTAAEKTAALAGSVLDQLVTYLGTDGAKSKFESFMTALGKGIGTAASKIADTAGKIVNGFVTYLASEDGREKISAMMTTIGSGLGDAVGELAVVAEDIVSQFVNSMLDSETWKKLGAGLVTIFRGAYDFFDSFFTQIDNKLAGRDQGTDNVAQFVLQNMEDDYSTGYRKVNVGELIKTARENQRDEKELAEFLKNVGVLEDYSLNDNGLLSGWTETQEQQSWGNGAWVEGTQAKIRQLAEEFYQVPLANPFEEAVESFNNALDSVSGSTSSAADEATTKVNEVGNSLEECPDEKIIDINFETHGYDSAIQQINSIMSYVGAGISAAPHAKGLGYVPYDGYIAELHRGEQVVMANQARGGSNFDMGELTSAITSAIASAMTNVQINMDGEPVGNIVTDVVSRNIAMAARGRRFAP